MLPEPLLYLSAYFEQNRSEYYDLLLRTSQQGDLMPWLKFFLRGVRPAGSGTPNAERIG